MTTNDKALINWNEQENRYELHIDDVLKGYSVASEGAEDAQESHKGGFAELSTIAKENGYTVIVGSYKADAEKEEGE